MKNFVYLFAICGTLLLTACGSVPAEPTQPYNYNEHNHDHDHDHNHSTTQDYNGDIITVVTTFSILADMVYQVGGELVSIYNIVPIGDNPEDHEVLPSNLIAAAEADLIFYNGINLETAGYWFEELIAAIGAEGEERLIRTTVGIPHIYLTTEGLEEYEDPHAWLDLSIAIMYVQNIANALIQFAPQHADVFSYNANVFSTQLLNLHEQWVGAFDHIDESRRIIVTAEGALRYFGLAYNINTLYIWEINAEEEGTPEQMINIISQVNASNVPYLFTESSVEPDYIEQVSEETGVPIFGMLFTDSIGEPSTPTGTFYGMMRHNFETIYSALSE